MALGWQLVGLPGTSSNQRSEPQLCAGDWEEEAEEVAVREFALLPRVRQRGQHVTVLTEDGSKDQGSPRQTWRCFRWSDCFFPPGFRTLQFWTFSLNKLQYWPYIVMIEDS